MADYIQGSLFEEDYLLRTLGAIVRSPDIALTELVANAWDGGASIVDIRIPDERNTIMTVEDNGIGMTQQQFHERWMRLGYNRVKHQGKKVTFPPGQSGNRIAYGRNGVGRHSLLCFDDEYKVITTCDGKSSTFAICTLSEDQPFVIKNEEFTDSQGHGTRLEVCVKRNLPNPDRILEVISARFLHDPQFTLRINGKSVPLEEHVGLIDSTELNIKGKKIEVLFIDSQKAARRTLYQGIAFWQGGRLVGEPSWILGKNSVIDGRIRFAKQYTVVAKSNDLADYVNEDWTDFTDGEVMEEIYSDIAKYVEKMFKQIAEEHIEETKQNIKADYNNEIIKLSALGQYEIDEVIEDIAIKHPTTRPEVMSIAIEAVIELEKSRSGKELLQKLAILSEEDIAGLNQLLGKWTVKDALCVLDEIDRRISVIEAIKKLSSDKKIDELKILHPLVTEARWLFGPEFDSPEYTSNSQLKTAVKELFKVKVGAETFENHRKRPDIVVLPESTISVTGTDTFDHNSNMASLTKILIIELKRGGFELTRKERDQAVGYVEDFLGCGSIIGNPYVYAFVVGEKFSRKIQPVQTVKNDNEIEVGQVRISTFSQLVDTAERRLFRLREKLNSRYEEISGMELYKRTTQKEFWR